MKKEKAREKGRERRGRREGEGEGEDEGEGEGEDGGEEEEVKMKGEKMVGRMKKRAMARRVAMIFGRVPTFPGAWTANLQLPCGSGLGGG